MCVPDHRNSTIGGVIKELDVRVVGREILMSKLGSPSRRSSSGKRRHASSKVRTATFEQIPKDLASLVRGLYRRVARKLHVDASYVSRVARGERQSGMIEGTLR